MPIVLTQPAGILRNRLLEAIKVAPEDLQDELVVNIVKALEELGFSISGNGWLDDDEALENALWGRESEEEEDDLPSGF